jgi:uncharacterized membrane protein
MTRKTWHQAHKDTLTTGDRAADLVRNKMGSWGFVFGFLAFMVVWALINTFTPAKWDVYPFILLNLFLSLLAGMQGAILLIAAKRQDAVAAVTAQHDLDTDILSQRGIAELLLVAKSQTRIITDQGLILKRLQELIDIEKG